MANMTFTFSKSSGSWDTASNWDYNGTPTSPTYSVQGNSSYDGQTTFVDSFVLNGTSTFGDNGTGADLVANVTIDSGALLTASPIYGHATADQLTFDGTIDILAGGTLGLGGAFSLVSSVGANGDLATNAGTVYDDGTIIGSGYIDNAVTVILGSGVIISQSDSINSQMVIAAKIAGSISIEVASGTSIDLQNATDAGTTLALDTSESNGAASAELDDPGKFNSTIAGLNVANYADTSGGTVRPAGINYLDVAFPSGGSVVSAVYTYTGGADSNGHITISTTDTTDFPSGIETINVSGRDYTGDTVLFAPDSGGIGGPGTDFFFSTPASAVCFAAATHILTPTGQRSVDSLSPGDHVITVVDGQHVARPVKWIGYRKLTLDARAMAAGLAPVRIKRGSMAEGLPVRDLLVSPPHCMFLDGKLIPAKLLVNDMTIVRETAMTAVEYYHVELDRHAVIIAEGVETESYLDTGNRVFFGNAGLALILHPEFHVNAGRRCWDTDACAPLTVSPAAVLPVWRLLADRALSLGFVPPSYATTIEADIHLMADGRRIDAIAAKGQVHSFMVPAGVKSLALASRSVVPNVLVRYLDDPRELGVAVRGITIRGGANVAVFAADHPVLVIGWHAPERSDGALWRWTSGLGALPVGVVEGPVVVDVHVSETTTYLVDDVQTESRLAA